MKRPLSWRDRLTIDRASAIQRLRDLGVRRIAVPSLRADLLRRARPWWKKVWDFFK